MRYETIKNININYLCSNIASLLAVPVRVFERKIIVQYYSIINLPKDPVEPYLDEIFAMHGHISYFVTKNNYCYGIVNYKDNHIVIGPTTQFSVDEQELHRIAFELNVQHDQVNDFINGMKSISKVPLMSLLQTLCVLNHFVNYGEELSLPDISIIDSVQKNFIEKFELEETEKTIKNVSGYGKIEYLHNTLDIENFIIDSISRGDISELKDFFLNVPAINGGLLAQDELRQSKNLLIVSVTLISRAAIHGGMDVEESLSMSDNYIQKCELLTTTEAVTNLNYRMIMDYAERMEKLRCGKKQSKLVAEIYNYVQKHLSENITVDKLARFLYRGRSRLSTDFKKETGENLSDYIINMKIEESKRLLKYTNKSISDISFYLGFSSQGHFSKLFKKYAKTTPREFREISIRKMV